MELTVLHRVTNAIVNADAEYHLAQTAFNRWVASQQEVNSRRAVVLGGAVGREGENALPNLLDALRRQADAQREYYQRLVNYNKAIADVHLAKGSLLEYDGVRLAEGPWPKKAYWDALGHARRRDASYYLDYGWSQPGVVSRGPISQMTADAPIGNEIGVPYGVPTEADPQGETIPTPPPSDAEEAPGTLRPEALPSPSLEGPVVLPDDTASRRKTGEASRANVAKSTGSTGGNRFDWGTVGLAPSSDQGVRQASAEIEIEPPQSAKANALQWVEPGKATVRGGGNWKPTVR